MLGGMESLPKRKDTQTGSGTDTGTGAGSGTEIRTGAGIRIVLDTNVVVALLVFADPLLVAVRKALDRGSVIPLADDETLAELERVLHYPELRVDEERAVMIARHYRLLCTAVREGEQHGPLMRLPLCSDRDDQKFLLLAQRGRAEWLLTRDKALLAMRRRVPFAIATPEAWITPSHAPGE